MIKLEKLTLKRNGITHHLNCSQIFRDSEQMNKRLKQLQSKFEIGSVKTIEVKTIDVEALSEREKRQIAEAL